MRDWKLLLHPFYPSYRKKITIARATRKDFNDVKSSEIVNECLEQNCFRRFKECDTSVEEKTTSGRPSIAEGNALFEIVLRQPSTNTLKLSSDNGPHKLASIDIFIISASETDTDILKIQTSLK